MYEPRGAALRARLGAGSEPRQGSASWLVFGPVLIRTQPTRPTPCRVVDSTPRPWAGPSIQRHPPRAYGTIRQQEGTKISGTTAHLPTPRMP
ncbi:hypothetical protein BOTBODRAFT_251341 [Botryobasidium botryosum FD-172 SS1]|uniref:Uncharacterized protein n=1 Tax=Botryobasidium botryosum (strain FD-172 SS1) TaxID=930990 RepID=A0A067LQK7_BOTB1|nr:hypothetical protein BOTBODRAFT_374683 [Botryobasidium botryosum FD-172 SS1]KDQ16513.1 hypothetical protein BOTBODRAFT_251341 [Botryobasidium botryosum FD-172 SS1]